MVVSSSSMLPFLHLQHEVASLLYMLPGTPVVHSPLHGSFGPCSPLSVRTHPLELGVSLEIAISLSTLLRPLRRMPNSAPIVSLAVS
jgi:hypothetical protein